MTLQKLLEKFDPLSLKTISNAEPTALAPAEVEALRTQTFEAGYASGWEDATSAESEARKRIDAEFERNIQSLAFTYTEAVDRVRSELTKFISTLVDSFFPEIVPDLLREHVRSELTRLADDMIEGPLEIVTSPDCADLLRDMLQTDFSMEIDLVSDPNLAERQVFVRIATREVEIDLAPLLGALREQFKAMRQQPDGKAVNDDG